MLAGRAIGRFADWRSAAKACPQAEEIIHPNEKTQLVYAQMFEIYRQSVGPLQAISARLQRVANTRMDGAHQPASGQPRST